MSHFRLQADAYTPTLCQAVKPSKPETLDDVLAELRSEIQPYQQWSSRMAVAWRLTMRHQNKFAEQSAEGLKQSRKETLEVCAALIDELPKLLEVCVENNHDAEADMIGKTLAACRFIHDTILGWGMDDRPLAIRQMEIRRNQRRAKKGRRKIKRTIKFGPAYLQEKAIPTRKAKARSKPQKAFKPSWKQREDLPEL